MILDETSASEKLHEIEFEPLSKENVKIAGKIQYEAFHEVGLCGYCDYLAEVDGKTELTTNFLARVDGQPAGIVGINAYKEYPDDIFMDWLGVLPEFRQMGLATKLFEFGIDLAKKTGRKWLRLYTFPKEPNGGGARDWVVSKICCARGKI